MAGRLNSSGRGRLGTSSGGRLGTSTRGRLGSLGGGSSATDLDSLKLLAQQYGLDVQEKKPSLFSRAMDLLSRGTYASAGFSKALVKGNENPFQEAYKGLKGEEKEAYADVLEEAGVKNKYVRGGLGFALDVALDPTTYFGGSLVKAGGKALGKVGSAGVKAASKFAPESMGYLEAAGKNLKDAFGTAFKFGYGTTAGLADDVSRSINRLGIAKDETVTKYIDTFKEITPEEQTQLAETLFAHKRKVVDLEKSLSGEGITEINKLFPDLKIKDQKQAEQVLKVIEDVTADQVKNIRSKIDEIMAPMFKERQKMIKSVKFIESKTGLQKTPSIGSLGKVDSLNRVVDKLKKQLKELRKGAGTVSVKKMAEDLGGEVTEKEINDVKNRLIKYEEERLSEVIEDLSSKIENYKSKPKSKKDPFKKLNPEELIIYGERKIKKLQNDLADKTKLLDKIVGSRKIAKEKVNASKPEFKTPKQEKFFNEKLQPLINELGKKTGLPEEELFKYYIPSLSKEKLKAVSQSSGALKTGSEGYLKKYMGKIADEDLINKPIEAYARREYEIVRDKITKDTLDELVKVYGKDKSAFTNAAEAAKEGFVELKDKQFGKVVGYLKEQDAKFINDYLFPEYKTLDLLAKGSGYDALTSFFKTAVTAYFPSFHVRNFISGAVQNYEVIGTQAFNPKNYNTAFGILKGGDKPLELGGYNTKEIQNAIKETFGGSSRYISDLGDYIDEIAGNNFKMKKISNARKLGNFIETYQKTVTITGALRQGKTLEQALKLAEKAGFDYSKITKFEQKVLRRLIPFYTFARKNAGLQLATLKDNPERILNVKKLADSMSVMFGDKVTEEDVKGLPEWVLSGLGFKISGNKYLSQFGFAPEEFAQRLNAPLKTTLISLNPIIKFPLEAKTGRDFFRDQKLIDVNQVAPATGEMLMKLKEESKLPEWFEKTINISSYVSSTGETKYTASPQALHVLRNLPTSRLQSTLEKMFNKDMEKVDKWLAFFTGAKIYDIDVEKQKYFDERNLQRDIEDQLIARGVGKKFSKFYIPEE